MANIAMTRTEALLWWALFSALCVAIYLGYELEQCTERHQLAREQTVLTDYIHRVQAQAYNHRTDLCQCGCDQEQPTTNGDSPNGAVAQPH